MVLLYLWVTIRQEKNI
jgi:hypothetical protein